MQRVFLPTPDNLKHNSSTFVVQIDFKIDFLKHVKNKALNELLILS